MRLVEHMVVSYINTPYTHLCANVNRNFCNLHSTYVGISLYYVNRTYISIILDMQFRRVDIIDLFYNYKKVGRTKCGKRKKEEEKKKTKNITQVLTRI